MKKVSRKTELMSAIREEVISLTASPLYEYRTTNNFHPVIGEGSLDAKIMFVGEAPGRNEAKTGRPFCGAAGKVLDKLLDHVDLNRDSIYITNIIKDRPPENRDPTQKEIEVYGPFLDRQIEIIKPRIIVALGRYAMIYIMNRFGLEKEIETIGAAHGKAYHTKSLWRDDSGSFTMIDIVTLYHPCVAVYNPRNLPNLMKDMEILKNY